MFFASPPGFSDGLTHSFDPNEIRGGAEICLLGGNKLARHGSAPPMSFEAMKTELLELLIVVLRCCVGRIPPVASLNRSLMADRAS